MEERDTIAVPVKALGKKPSGPSVYKTVTLNINGVTKNVMVPVSSMLVPGVSPETLVPSVPSATGRKVPEADGISPTAKTGILPATSPPILNIPDNAIVANKMDCPSEHSNPIQQQSEPHTLMNPIIVMPDSVPHGSSTCDSESRNKSSLDTKNVTSDTMSEGKQSATLESSTNSMQSSAAKSSNSLLAGLLKSPSPDVATATTHTIIDGKGNTFIVVNQQQNPSQNVNSIPQKSKNSSSAAASNITTALPPVSNRPESVPAFLGSDGKIYVQVSTQPVQSSNYTAPLALPGDMVTSKVTANTTQSLLTARQGAPVLAESAAIKSLISSSQSFASSSKAKSMAQSVPMSVSKESCQILSQLANKAVGPPALSIVNKKQNPQLLHQPEVPPCVMTSVVKQSQPNKQMTYTSLSQPQVLNILTKPRSSTATQWPEANPKSGAKTIAQPMVMLPPTTVANSLQSMPKMQTIHMPVPSQAGICSSKASGAHISTKGHNTSLHGKAPKSNSVSRSDIPLKIGSTFSLANSGDTLFVITNPDPGNKSKQNMQSFKSSSSTVKAKGKDVICIDVEDGDSQDVTMTDREPCSQTEYVTESTGDDIMFPYSDDEDIFDGADNDKAPNDKYHVDSPYDMDKAISPDISNKDSNDTEELNMDNQITPDITYSRHKELADKISCSTNNRQPFNDIKECSVRLRKISLPFGPEQIELNKGCPITHTKAKILDMKEKECEHIVNASKERLNVLEVERRPRLRNKTKQKNTSSHLPSEKDVEDKKEKCFTESVNIVSTDHTDIGTNPTEGMNTDDEDSSMPTESVSKNMHMECDTPHKELFSDIQKTQLKTKPECKSGNENQPRMASVIHEQKEEGKICDTASVSHTQVKGSAESTTLKSPSNIIQGLLSDPKSKYLLCKTNKGNFLLPVVIDKESGTIQSKSKGTSLGKVNTPSDVMGLSSIVTELNEFMENAIDVEKPLRLHKGVPIFKTNSQDSKQNSANGSNGPVGMNEKTVQRSDRLNKLKELIKKNEDELEKVKIPSLKRHHAESLITPSVKPEVSCLQPCTTRVESEKNADSLPHLDKKNEKTEDYEPPLKARKTISSTAAVKNNSGSHTMDTSNSSSSSDRIKRLKEMLKTKEDLLQKAKQNLEESKKVLHSLHE